MEVLQQLSQRHLIGSQREFGGRESSDGHTILSAGILQQNPMEFAAEILQRIPMEQERWELLCFGRVDNRKQLAKACNEEVSCAQVD